MQSQCREQEPRLRCTDVAAKSPGVCQNATCVLGLPLECEIVLFSEKCPGVSDSFTLKSSFCVCECGELFHAKKSWKHFILAFSISGCI